MLKLIKRIEGKSLPLEKVSTEISAKIKKAKAATIVREYIDKLKTRADISTNETTWQKIRAEFGVKANANES